MLARGIIPLASFMTGAAVRPARSASFRSGPPLQPEPMQDNHILLVLQRKYAELLGELMEGNARVEALSVDIAAMERVMRLYRADWTGEDVKPRRPSYPSRYLKVGQGVQTALDVLRTATEPMTVREVVAAIMDRLAIPHSPGAVKSLESSVRFCLEKRIGTGIVAVSERPRRFAVERVLDAA